MTNTAAGPASKNTSAFFLQSILAFGIALAVVVIGEVYLPVPAWTRAFLALGTVFLVSASFTLAKCVRDQQETESVVSRIDQARLERMLADYDPYRVPTLSPEQPGQHQSAQHQSAQHQPAQHQPMSNPPMSTQYAPFAQAQ